MFNEGNDGRTFAHFQTLAFKLLACIIFHGHLKYLQVNGEAWEILLQNKQSVLKTL